MPARDRCPRPAEILPPTLLPNPVLLAAPSPDRMTSLMAACVVYCALGAAVLGGARKLAIIRPPTGGGTVVLEDPRELPVLPETRPLPVPSGATTRPAGFTPVVPVLDPYVLPTVTPTALPHDDHSREIGVPPGTPVGPRVEGLASDPAPQPPPRAIRVVQLEHQQVRILHQVQPVYPALARLTRAQGTVELRMTIDGAGVPTEVEVLSGPHPLLIGEAVRVARLWRFQPAMVDGAAVPASFRLTVGFRLER